MTNHGCVLEAASATSIVLVSKRPCLSSKKREGEEDSEAQRSREAVREAVRGACEQLELLGRRVARAEDALLRWVTVQERWLELARLFAPAAESEPQSYLGFRWCF